MFEKSKGRYLTRGVDAEIPIALQVMMWQAVDQMPEPKDYRRCFSSARRTVCRSCIIPQSSHSLR